jgi:hypothetical protein
MHKECTESWWLALQEHGSILPMLMAGKTAQPAAMTPLAIINEGFEQLEKLAVANLKGGVFQGVHAGMGLDHQPQAAAAAKGLLGGRSIQLFDGFRSYCCQVLHCEPMGQQGAGTPLQSYIDWHMQSHAALFLK